MEPINGLFVYAYEHDDDLQGWTPIEQFTYPSSSDPKKKERFSPAFINNLSSTLKACGWEGDGTLSAMMVPPFFAKGGYGHWFPIFHVKQDNNGTSWIASESELSADGLNGDLPRDFYDERKKQHGG